jgi:hypothetical protein
MQSARALRAGEKGERMHPASEAAAAERGAGGRTERHCGLSGPSTGGP